jgi:hypothetical protein
MKDKKIRSGLVFDEIRADEWVLGSQAIDGQKIELGGVMNPSGDWRTFARGEKQERNGLETMSCATFGTLNAIEMMLRYSGRQEVDYSERFTSTLAGTTPNGNSPHKVSETIRKKGLLREDFLPFDKHIVSWDQFYSGITDTHLRQAKQFTKQFTYNHKWVWTGKVANQRVLLTEALQRSPVGVAVYGWAYEEAKKLYIKPQGVRANHWALLVGSDEDGAWVVLDSYEPFIKRLDPNYDFEIPKVYTLEQASPCWLVRMLQY